MTSKAKRKTQSLKAVKTNELLKLDIGCGPRKREGFKGVDRLAFEGVDIIHDFSSIAPWPWDDESVEEVHCSHFLEHLTMPHRVHFFNELHRVLIHGGKATIATPHWASNRAYGDPTHQWPPVCEMFYYYLNRHWRTTQAPHTDAVNDKMNGLSCNFDFNMTYNIHPEIAKRAPAYVEDAVAWYKEAVQDLVAIVVKPTDGVKH